MNSSRQNGRENIQQVWYVFIAAIYVQSSIVVAQNFCTSDDNCQFNEFCNLDEGMCISCIDCLRYNRNGTDNECPKNVTQDCGECLPGFGPSVENHMDIDFDIGYEVCQAIDLAKAQSTDYSTVSLSKASLTTVVTDPDVKTPDQAVKVTNVQPHAKADNGSFTMSSTEIVSDLSDVQPTNQSTSGYDEYDAKRPWIYVGIGATFFVLCGTCGVVGFKVFLLPRQLKRKAELRKVRAIERAERNTRKTIEDTASASKEEIERLYPDRGQDSTPLILRGYLNKNVREASH